MSIQERLQELIDDLKLSQSDLARNIDTDRTVVSRWFTGSNPPSKGSIRKICKSTGCNYEWLLSGQGPMMGVGESIAGEKSFGRKPFLTEKAFSRSAPLTEDEVIFYGGLDGIFSTITEWLEEDRGTDSLTVLNFILELHERFPSLRAWIKKKGGSTELAEEFVAEKRDKASNA